MTVNVQTLGTDFGSLDKGAEIKESESNEGSRRRLCGPLKAPRQDNPHDTSERNMTF